jgi:flagellar assembly protein FliH
MNLLSEPNADVVANVAARLEYRALGEEELEVSYPGGERRRMERRALPQTPAGSPTISDDAWRDAVKTAQTEGLAQGEREGRLKARAEMEPEIHMAVARERARIEGAIEDFEGAKQLYFAEIEGQVVRLALAIAARVLHRETQVDALVLGGAVRVALEKLAERNSVVLRAAESDVEAWERMFAESEMTQTPKVSGDATLRRGDCVLETSMGMVELSVKTQLEEIEKGFYDLLSLNPAARS